MDSKLYVRFIRRQFIQHQALQAANVGENDTYPTPLQAKQFSEVLADLTLQARVDGHGILSDLMNVIYVLRQNGEHVLEQEHGLSLRVFAYYNFYALAVFLRVLFDVWPILLNAAAHGDHP